MKSWHAAGVYQGPSSNPTKRKRGCGPGIGELPEIWGFPFNISATAEASDFKFGTQLGFAKAYHKITPREKSGVALGYRGALQNFGVPYNGWGLATSNLARSWGLPRPIIKSHP